MTAPEVAVQHLRASYDRRVFTDVTFTAAPGVTTVVSGPSGIGKTTLVRVLLGGLAPDRGEVMVGDRSVVGASPAELAEVHARTGFLYSGLGAGAAGRKRFRPGPDIVDDDPGDGVRGSESVGDNVRRALAGGDADRLARCLADFDLVEHEHRRARDLDAGARRRLGLARVFVADPTLVVLDDPVAGLDPAARDDVVAALVRVRATSTATILVTCYDLTTTQALGDQLVTLVAGRVRKQGPVGEMLDGITTEREFASAFSVGGKEFEDRSQEALTEHQTGVGLERYDQRLFLGTITVLGVVFLLAVVAFIALRLML